MGKKKTVELEVGESYKVKSYAGKQWSKYAIFFGRTQAGELIFGLNHKVSARLLKKYHSWDSSWLIIQKYDASRVSINSKVGRYVYTGNVVSDIDTVSTTVGKKTYWDFNTIERARTHKDMHPSHLASVVGATIEKEG